jgi:hypothetical protein
MKLKTIITGAALTLLTAGVTQGAHLWDDPNAWASGHFVYDVSTPRFTAQELSFDAFGSYLAGERKFNKLFETNIRHGTWGGGVGLNYFFLRELGLGVDMNIPDNGGNFIDSVSGSLIGRFPLGQSGWAPYIFGGGGRGTDPTWEWLGHAGVGMEYRFNPGTGIFVDGRYIWHDKSYDRLLLRAGFRLVF